MAGNPVERFGTHGRVSTESPPRRCLKIWWSLLLPPAVSRQLVPFCSRSRRVMFCCGNSPGCVESVQPPIMLRRLTRGEGTVLSRLSVARCSVANAKGHRGRGERERGTRLDTRTPAICSWVASLGLKTLSQETPYISTQKAVEQENLVRVQLTTMGAAPTHGSASISMLCCLSSS